MEISHSGANYDQLDFRIRTSVNEKLITLDPTEEAHPTASLTLLFLEDPTMNTTVNIPSVYSEVVSSNNLPPWPSSFVRIRDYIVFVTGSVSVSGSLYCNSISGTLFGTASWAQNVFAATSASWVSQSNTPANFAISSSWASSSLSSSFLFGTATGSNVNGVSFFGTASNAISSSFATSASRAITASYVLGSGTGPGSFLRAFGTFYATGSLGNSSTPNQPTWVPFSGSYNFISGAYQGVQNQTPAAGVATSGMQTSSLITLQRVTDAFGPLHCWIFYMSTPMPTLNYTVMCSAGGEQSVESVFLQTLPVAPRTTTAFTMSYCTPSNANWDDRYPGVNEFDWVQIMVLHP